MSKISILKFCIMGVWLVIGVLTLFDVLGPFSEKTITFVVCLLFIDNIARSINKEKA